jgi:hypothetical protein
MESLLQDTRHSIRTLTKNPGFTHGVPNPVFGSGLTPIPGWNLSASLPRLGTTSSWWEMESTTLLL